MKCSICGNEPELDNGMICCEKFICSECVCECNDIHKTIDNNMEERISLTDDEAKEFKECVELEGSEIGELCNLLLSIQGYEPYFLSSNLKEAIEKEIRKQYNNFKEFSEIEEEEFCLPQKYKVLNWK